MKLSTTLRKFLSLLIIFSFFLQQTGFAQGIAQLDISRYIGNFTSSPQFRPVLLRYFSYNPSTESFQLLLDKGSLKGIKTEEVKEEGRELLKYFLIGVTLPNSNFWVNLRPDSEDEIITEELSKTDLGKVLLDADLKLKKDVATFTSPETPEGREYWNKLYQKAGEFFSGENITIPTLTRPWIVPGEVIIRETQESVYTERGQGPSRSAYVYKATLKVMLEQDYLQSPSNVIASNQPAVIARSETTKQSLYNTYTFSRQANSSKAGSRLLLTESLTGKDPRLQELNEYSSQLIRELIIPKLTKEVNSSERYAALRQVFFSLILSRWFKNKFAATSSSLQGSAHSSLRGAAPPSSLRGASVASDEAISAVPSYIKLIDSGDLTGLTSKEPWSKTTYFEEYKKSFAQGEYNIKEQVNSITGSVIRTYFSGGANLTGTALPVAGLTAGSPIGIWQGIGAGFFSILRRNRMFGLAGRALLPGALELKIVPDQEVASAAYTVRANVPAAASPITAVQIKRALDKFNTVNWAEEIAKKHVFLFTPEDVVDEIRSFGPEGERLVKKALKVKEKIDRGEKPRRDERVTPEEREFLEDLLGGKGAHLFEMALLGFNVPRGFTTITRATERHYDIKQLEEILNALSNEDYSSLDKALKQRLDEATANIKLYREKIDAEEENALRRIEVLEGKKLGDKNNPLLISARSGAKFSMPGMMDTVLNIGLNDDNALAGSIDMDAVKGLPEEENRRFVYDSYRRLLSMFGDIVLKTPRKDLDQLLYETKRKFAARKGMSLEGVSDINDIVKDIDLEAQDLKDLIEKYKALIIKFPQDPEEQRKLARNAVMDSSTGKLAMDYRRMYRIPLEGSFSAVNFVVMKYGNIGINSGTGVAFTLDPNTGEMLLDPEGNRTLYGDILSNAQGEDVVAGIRKTDPIIRMKETFPKAYSELLKGAAILEAYYGDMQDIEFTVENGILYFLQTRTGKRTAQAEITIGVNQVDSEDIAEEDAILRFEKDVSSFANIFSSQPDPEEMDQIRKGEVPDKKVIGEGTPAGPGVVVGRAFFSAEAVENAVKEIKNRYAQAKNAGATQEQLAKIEEEGKVILVRPETKADDVPAMEKALGVVTSRGGKTSHAAVVGRGMGKVVVVGANIKVEEKKFTGSDGTIINEGEWFSVNGFTGEIIKDKVRTIPSIVIRGIDQEQGIELREEEKLTPQEQRFYDRFKRFYKWVIARKGIGVQANAEQLKDVLRSLSFGAEGIGLARTEHQFFDVAGQKRLIHMQAMILAETEEEREKALKGLISVQKEDFVNIFRAENENPVIIRLIDPPLHEFTPKDENDENYEELVSRTGKTREQIQARIKELEEENPMLGHRGNRLAFTYPEILRAQVTAIVMAAQEMEKEGIRVNVKIMIPLVSNLAELMLAKRQVVETANGLGYRYDQKKYKIGTMIELVSAALLADKLAGEVDFFSFGTNDLTQTTLEFSREDADNIVIPAYLERKILPDGPFAILDEIVWQLAGIAVKKARAGNRNIEIGICGEHGGEPISIWRFRQAGFDYVSASPYRIPVAYLQSAIDEILAKRGKLPLAPEFKLLVDEAPMGVPQRIRRIPEIKDALSIEEAVRQAVTLVEEGKITRGEAIANLNLSKLAEGLSQGLLEASDDFQEILRWARRLKSVGIAALVENEQDVERLSGLSQAEGIFVQTENTFLDRIEATRRVIFADTDERREEEGKKLAKLQLGFYNALFAKENLQGRAVTIRLLDLGLKSFIQGLTDEDINKLATYLEIGRDTIQKKKGIYFEINPAFGNKGSRSALTLQPDLYRAQLRAIFQASIEQGVSSEINILAPFLIDSKEFIAMKDLIDEEANKVRKETGKELKYKVIPAIATPRAALTAERFAQETDSAVIDAVELTDGVLGMTEKDAQSFLPAYLKENIYPADPYKSIYKEAVGLLLRESILSARQFKPEMGFAVRGYGNDPASIEFFHQAGANTIITSPKDIDLAILSAAQAAINYPRPAKLEISVQAVKEDRGEGVASLPMDIQQINEQIGKLESERTGLEGQIKQIKDDKTNRAEIIKHEVWPQFYSPGSSARPEMVRLETYQQIDSVGIHKAETRISEIKSELWNLYALRNKETASASTQLRPSAASPLKQIPETPGGIDASTSSASIPETGEVGGIDTSTSLSVDSTLNKNMGGIDFTSIPMITQPMGNMSGLNFTLPKLSNVEKINLNEELSQIQNMLRAGITPSDERLKEFVAACYQKGELKTYLEGIVASVVDTCKLQEERVEVTSNTLKEVMLILDSIS